MKRTLTLTAHRHNEQSNVYNFTDSDGNEWAMFGNQKGTSTSDPAVTTLAAELAKSLGTPQELDAYEKDGKRYIFGRPKAGGGRKPERDEDRMDARTALMQAVEALADGGPWEPQERTRAILATADDFLGWLRKQHGASVGAGVRGSTSAPPEQSGNVGKEAISGSAAKGSTSFPNPARDGDPERSRPPSRGTGGARSKVAVKPGPGSAAGPHAPAPETPQAPSGPLSWIDAEALQALKVVMPGANVQALDKWMRIWCRRHDMYDGANPVCPHPPSDKFDELMDAIATLAHQEKLA